MTAPTFVDLFSGAGGWTCGLEMAGLRRLAAFDFNASACRTLGRNAAGHVACVDLREPPAGLFDLRPDVVVGSPPCQGFSNEGKKRADDPRNGLVDVYLGIVERLAPRAWVFENVPGFQRSYGGAYFEWMRRRLASMDYETRTFLLDASDFGVPQRRVRFLAMGAKRFAPVPPPPTHFAEVGLFGAAPLTTLWEAISDLPRVGPGERTGEFEYDQAPRSVYQAWARDGCERVVNHTTQRHSARVLEKIRSVPAGSGMEMLVGRYRENQVHYEGGYRRAEKDKPSWTAYWTRGMTSIHPEQDRFLSPRECARIQSFPDRWAFHGTTIENYTQVCNAVPPLLARAIGQSLRSGLEGASVAPATMSRPLTAAG